MNWYDVLEVARKASREGLVRSTDIADSIKIQKRPGETGAEFEARRLKVASAWMGKFVRWGYLIRERTEPNGQARPTTVYRLTRWGLEMRRKGQKVQRKIAANPEE